MKSRLTTLSASLWGCELKCQIIHTRTQIIKVSLLVRLWVEIPTPRTYHVTCSSSASLWGCELKCLIPFCYKPVKIVSLLVRLWVEMVRFPVWQAAPTCQPPCEAVSWNTLHAFVKNWRQQSASLWGCELKSQTLELSTVRSGCQPPCEAVSWNTKEENKKNGRLGQPPCEAVSWNLSIRCIIELSIRQPPCEAVSWNISSFGSKLSLSVSLLVRLWVEI